MSKVVLTDARAQTRVISNGDVGGGLGALGKSGLSPLGILVTRCEVALAGLFLLAAFTKLQPPNGPQLFSASVQAFKLGLPDALVRLATSATPWVEIIAGLLLLAGIWSRAAAAVLSLLLCAFIVLISQALLRGLNVECGCFGKLSPFCPQKLGPCNLVQNGVMLAAGLLITMTPRGMLARGGSRG